MDKKIVTEMVNDIIEDKITQFIESISSDEFIEEVTDRVIQGGVPVDVENEEEVEGVREIIGSKVVSFITKQIFSTNNNKTIFLLMGNFAISKSKLIDNKHIIFTTTHPSPLSAYNGFFGCNVFKKINDKLEENNMDIINW
jgi:hypothetical protein